VLHRPPQPRRQAPKLSTWHVMLVALLAPGLYGCEQTVVTPADPAALELRPDQAQVTVGGNVQFTAELKDDNGRAITGYPVIWASDDDRIATVTGDGLVTGAASGSTVIRGQAGTVTGTATIRVLIPPSIVLSRSSVEFVVGDGPLPGPVAVAITNGGEADLTGLSASISYLSGDSGWLSATLSRTAAPATLTLAVNPGNWTVGQHRATIHVTASSVPGSPVAVEVRMEVTAPEPPRRRPGPPQSLAVELTQPDRILLSWARPGDEVREVGIERRTGTSAFTSLATVSAETRSFEDRGLAGGTRYTYRLRACNDVGCSDPSAEVAITTPSPSTLPPVPTNFRAEMVQKQRVRLAWSFQGDTPVVFRVERAQGSSAFSVLDTTREDVSFYDDRDVEGGRTYRYRIAACNSTGCSATTAAIEVRTPD
jgi:hypothetical protein